ncbi:tumor necrosis factor receptor superfamily member 10B-like isoform X2 [Sparus aurata]|uniref:tumor necrosis factor receptor superfamily member 10B-like isoform X2 n=1 Tax=Sparus aurata TaxID=8175 RepID=UPI0011C0CA8F|nr:tumor necrosis factor receptor superfamily member 10B-like isoform X2 [Sparus aurata]
MRGTRNHEIFFLLIFFSEPLGVLLLPGLAGGRSRTQRDVHCRENQEYLHGNICCLNCPAGTRLESPCTTAGRRGKCVECDDGTYTSHSNSLKWCIGCTKCREDQQIVKPCIHTQDAECQCKPGRFCVPAEACEVCKKCSRCGKDEVAVRNCTPTANTECKKIQPNLDSSSANIPWIVIVVVLAAVAAVFVGVLFYWKRCRSSDSQRELPGGLKAGQLYNDAEEGRNGESQMLSYTSLILPRPLEEKQFPTLIPVNGEESLRKCFEYFEEIDIDCHRRFFRHLGINDNVIKSKDGLPYDDKIHDLLNVWVEKEGIGASLNDLLRALLDLNQRLTAERVKDKAILNDHYFCEE